MSFNFTLKQKQTTLWLAVWLLLLAFLMLLGPVLTPFITAAILAYALHPGVDYLASIKIGKFHLPRVMAVIITMLILLAALMALMLIVLPVLQKELPLLQDQIPSFLNKINTIISPKLQEFGITANLDGSGIKQILSRQLSTGSEEIWSAILSSAKVGSITVLGWLATLVLIPVVLFYLLLDWHTLLQHVINAVPRAWLARTLNMAQEVNQLLAQYLRGQLLVMLILALYYSIALTIAKFDIALPIGLITGLLVFIPYVGFGLGLIMALIAAILQFSSMEGVIAVAIVYSIGQIIESFFLTPYLVGERIGLHPLIVIFALLAFGQLFGFVGVLLALPASAVLSVAFQHVRAHYLRSSFYNS